MLDGKGISDATGGDLPTIVLSGAFVSYQN
jgi:hypothetical protein